jgi:hypothetical protein
MFTSTQAQEVTEEVPLPPTLTEIPSLIPTFTEPPSLTPTLTATYTETPSETPTLSETPTEAPTETQVIPSATVSDVPLPTLTSTPIPTLTPIQLSVETPTLIPTASFTPEPAEASQSFGFVTLDSSTVTYRYAADMNELVAAIEEANSNSRYVIWLTGTEYLFDELDDTLEVASDVIVIGNNPNSPPTLRKTTTQDARAFYVLGSGKLLLRNLIIKDFQNAGTGGAVYNQHGQLLVYDVRFENNTSMADGGAITNLGTLNVWNSTFDNNRSQFGGGALRNNGGTIEVRCTTFSANRALYAGGINNYLGNTLMVNFSNFEDNIADREDLFGPSEAIYNEPTQLNVDALFNWWNHASGPRPVGQGDSVSPNVTFQIPPSILVQQSEVPIDDPVLCFEPEEVIVPPPSDPTPTPTPIVPPWDLNAYGIQLLHDEQEWNDLEEQYILDGANRVANAFSLFGTLGNTLPDKFKTVMGSNITFLRLAETQPANSPYAFYYSTSAGNCQTFDPNAIILTITVACRGFIKQENHWITGGLVLEQAVIHELGHVLDIRSGYQLRNIVGSGYFLADCTGNRTMGTSAGASWTRGERGWGSAVPQPNQQPPAQLISEFQQNPLNQTDHVEAVADMFLNWVYRRTTDNPPTNISNTPLSDVLPPFDACNYALAGTWRGFQNIMRDGSSDPSKPGNARYWWMEAVLDTMFSQQGWG